jgi:hypothetical protein
MSAEARSRTYRLFAKALGYPDGERAGHSSADLGFR